MEEWEVKLFGDAKKYGIVSKALKTINEALNFDLTKFRESSQEVFTDDNLEEKKSKNENLHSGTQDSDRPDKSKD